MCSSSGDSAEKRSEGDRYDISTREVDLEAILLYDGINVLCNCAAKNEAPFVAKTRQIKV